MSVTQKLEPQMEGSWPVEEEIEVRFGWREEEATDIVLLARAMVYYKALDHRASIIRGLKEGENGGKKGTRKQKERQFF